LRDRRNQILQQMSPIVDIRIVEGDNGSIYVQAAGATLVEGDIARVFSVDVDANGDALLMAQRSLGSSITDVTSGLSGGSLAGLKEARDVDLKSVVGSLDTFVYDIATALNTQHQAGYGMDGGTARNLFDLNLVGAPPAGASRTITVSVDIAGQANRIAASDSLTSLPGSGVNAKAITQVFDNPVTFGSQRTAAEGYSDIIGEVGIRRSNSKSESDLRGAMQAQFAELNDAASGVSLDEEMVNLTKYQRAYQAAAKVLSTVDELLQELLQRV
jgi:flagellar hook-associated protein 1